MGVYSEITEGSVVVAPMEGVMLLDVLAREAKALIAGWRSCGGWGMTVSNLSCVVVT